MSHFKLSWDAPVRLMAPIYEMDVASLSPFPIHHWKGINGNASQGKFLAAYSTIFLCTPLNA